MEKSNSFLYSFFGLIIFQFFMSLEEILGHFQEYLALLTGKVHKVISFFPVINLNDQFFLFINLLVFIIFIFIGILVFLNFRWSKILAVILGCIEIINGGLHILASLYFMQYIPGSISAVGLIIFGLLVIFIRPSVQQGATEEKI